MCQYSEIKFHITVQSMGNRQDKNAFVIAHHWGPGVASVKDGRLSNIGSHPDDPDPSRINENLNSVYGTARIHQPAIRRGYLEHGPEHTERNRGEDPFVPVSWDYALDLVCAELKRIRAKYGSKSIFAGSYGWASAGRFHHAQGHLKRFLSATGGFVPSKGNYSYNAALVLMPHIVGEFFEQLKLATRWQMVAKHGRMVVMFGGIPLRNAQVASGGIGRHTLRDDLIACARAGVKFINFSPLRTDAIEALDAEWLQPRPGSDTAIMMGLAHTLIRENLHDLVFLDRYTVGFDKIQSYLMGEVDDVAKDADWAEAQSGISADRIRQLARDMASQRTMICTAAGLQRTEYGEQPLWMTVTLAAMLGQIGIAGGGFGIAYGSDSAIGTSDRPARWPFVSQGENPVKDYIPVATIADMLLNPGGTYEYNGETRTYPDTRMVWWAGGNPFHAHQDLNRLHQAFQTPETVIVNEINWTATARHADIVLPSTSPLERTDFVAGSRDRVIIPMPQVIPPIGEARDEYDIYVELEKRYDIGTKFSEGKSSAEWLDEMWEEMRETVSTLGRSLPDFETFLEGDMITLDDPTPNAVLYSDFRQNPEKNPLETPSGKIELFSDVISGFGYDDCPGHATWLPPREWLGGEVAKDFPLHLVSGQPETRLHSQFDEGAFSRSRKIKGREPVLINPKDAAARGISDGDIVCLFNDRGEVLAGAIITEDIMENVVFLWTGAWHDPDYEHFKQRDRHGNPNVLTHDRRTSRLSQGPAAHSALVEVRKHTGPVPDVRAFDPPPFVDVSR